MELRYAARAGLLLFARILKAQKVNLIVINICRVAAFIKCGSRSETEETSGTAHFLEHLHFKVNLFLMMRLSS